MKKILIILTLFAIEANGQFIINPYRYATAAPATCPSNIVSRWQFNEGTGTNAADPCNSHDATLQGGVTWITGHIGSNAINVDGVITSFVEVASASAFEFGNSDFTVTLWIRTTASNKGITGHFKSGPFRGWFMYIGSSNELNLGVYGDGGGVDNEYGAGSVINDGAWHNIAMVVTRSGTNAAVECFVDGSSQGSFNGTVGDITGTTSFVLGTYILGGSTIVADFDDQRIYNIALSGTRITNIFNGTE